MMLARRTHLYAGLFLLPWVFLYGTTGAMFNHRSLFPNVTIQAVPQSLVASSAMRSFPSPNDLALQVVHAINVVSEDASVELPENPSAEFTNEVMFEVNVNGHKHVVHIDPLNHTSKVFTHPKQDFKPKRLQTGPNSIRLDPNPLAIVRRSAEHILNESGINFDSEPRQVGWTKLNFIATTLL